MEGAAQVEARFVLLAPAPPPPRWWERRRRGDNRRGQLGEMPLDRDIAHGELSLVRVEELYPWPGHQIAQIVDLYPAIEEVVWAQEEPKNQGAWSYASPRLRMSTGNALLTRYVGRPDRASPAEGYAEAHKKEQERIVAEVNAPVQQLAGAKRRGMAVKT